eukprot:scaffold5581_cov229-Prasinococcus_capsulatus_cf.AAC.7
MRSNAAGQRTKTLTLSEPGIRVRGSRGAGKTGVHFRVRVLQAGLGFVPARVIRAPVLAGLRRESPAAHCNVWAGLLGRGARADIAARRGGVWQAATRRRPCPCWRPPRGRPPSTAA